LTICCYSASRQFPNAEKFGLTSQLQRAAVSVPANIAEGHERSSCREYARHLSIAYASLAEVETHIEVAKRLGYLDTRCASDLLRRAAEVGKMINGIKRSLRNRLTPGT
jgi:four helix bundle protein